MALEDGGKALVEQQPECDVQPEHERDGGREGDVDLLLRTAGALPVEVVAR